MAPSPVTLTTNPQYLNARSGIYTAAELRKTMDYQENGPGVINYDSFRVRQRVAGAAGSVDVTAASVYNAAWIRGATAVPSANLPTAPFDTGMYLVDYNNATPINVDIAVGDGVNPRIDQVYLCIEDQQVTGSNNLATVRVVAGTPTGGATLDNRSGVGAAPAGMSSILLADVLQPIGNTNVLTANIRDRRPIGVPGVNGWGGAFFSQIDQQVLLHAAGMAPWNVGANGAVISAQYLAGATDNRQMFVPVYLARRMTGVTRIRWHYAQGATACVTNYNIGVYDASLRQIVTTGAVAFTGALNTQQARTEVIGATTFEAGLYVIGIGVAAMTAASSIGYYGFPFATTVAGGVGVVPCCAPNQGYILTTGGTTLPTTLSGFTDLNALAAGSNNVGVPLFAFANG